MIERIVNVERMEHAVALFGNFDENIKIVEKEYGVTILCRGTEVKIAGDEEQVEGQARTLLRTVESWRNHGERVQLLVVPSKPACGAMLQRMEQDGAALHVCAEEKALQWLKQLEQRTT